MERVLVCLARIGISGDYRCQVVGGGMGIVLRDLDHEVGLWCGESPSLIAVIMVDYLGDCGVFFMRVIL